MSSGYLINFAIAARRVYDGCIHTELLVHVKMIFHTQHCETRYRHIMMATRATLVPCLLCCASVDVRTELQESSNNESLCNCSLNNESRNTEPLFTEQLYIESLKSSLMTAFWMPYHRWQRPTNYWRVSIAMTYSTVHNMSKCTTMRMMML